MPNGLFEKIEAELDKTNQILSDVAKMVASHESYISDGKKWRMTVIGLVATMLIQVGGGLFLSGQINERVDNVVRLNARNEMRLDKNDERFERLIREARDYFRDEKTK